MRNNADLMGRLVYDDKPSSFHLRKYKGELCLQAAKDPATSAG